MSLARRPFDRAEGGPELRRMAAKRNQEDRLQEDQVLRLVEVRPGNGQDEVGDQGRMKRAPRIPAARLSFRRRSPSAAASVSTNPSSRRREAGNRYPAVRSTRPGAPLADAPRADAVRDVHESRPAAGLVSLAQARLSGRRVRAEDRYARRRLAVPVRQRHRALVEYRDQAERAARPPRGL